MEKLTIQFAAAWLMAHCCDDRFTRIEQDPVDGFDLVRTVRVSAKVGESHVATN